MPRPKNEVPGASAWPTWPQWDLGQRTSHLAARKLLKTNAGRSGWHLYRVYR